MQYFCCAIKNSLSLLFAITLIAGCVSGGGVADKQQGAQIYLELGLTYLSQDDFSRARFNLNKALALQPRLPGAHSSLAYFLEQVGEVGLARKHHRRAVRLADGQGEYLNNYGAFLCRVGEYQRAEKYFLKAVLDPYYLGIAQAYENAAICAGSIPDQEKAAYYFEKAVQHAPLLKRTLP